MHYLWIGLGGIFGGECPLRGSTVGRRDMGAELSLRHHDCQRYWQLDDCLLHHANHRAAVYPARFTAVCGRRIFGRLYHLFIL